MFVFRGKTPAQRAPVSPLPPRVRCLPTRDSSSLQRTYTMPRFKSLEAAVEWDQRRHSAGSNQKVIVCCLAVVVGRCTSARPRALKALAFQLLESTSPSSRWFQTDSTCPPPYVVALVVLGAATTLRFGGAVSRSNGIDAEELRLLGARDTAGRCCYIARSTHPRSLLCTIARLQRSVLCFQRVIKTISSVRCMRLTVSLGQKLLAFGQHN